MSEARALQDRFLVESELGRGGMGVVFRARERETGRPVALKIVLSQPDDRQRERFRREGELTARLNHPGIVRIHACGEADGRPWLAYELVEGGGTFEDALRTAAPEEQARLVRDAARALGVAHAQGILHRDVKPSNLLVDADGGVRVADFGLATARDLDRLTQTGALVGTPYYMAPELLSGKGAVGPACDVWALGVVLYEGLTGRLPFGGGSLFELAAEVERGSAVSPRAIDPSIPRALEAVCLCALARKPEQRYPDGEAMALDLDRFLVGDSVVAGRASQPGRRVFTAGLVAVTALALSVLAWAGTRPVALPVGPSAGPSRSKEPSELEVLRGKADAGDGAAAWELAERLLATGSAAEARRRLEAAAKADTPGALIRLARLLDAEGETAAAIPRWQRLADEGRPERLQALLRLAAHERSRREPLAALAHLRRAMALGWAAEPDVAGEVRALVAGADARAVRRWTLEVPLPKVYETELGRLSHLVASACGRGDWRADPAWFVARRSWLTLGYRTGDPTCALAVIREELSRGRRFQEEIASLIADRAAENRPDGLLALAKLHQRGLGRRRDDRRAYPLLKRAADAGYPPALTHMGRALRDGRGVRADGEQAAVWFRKGWAARERGSLIAMIRLLAAGRAPSAQGELLRWVKEGAAQGVAFTRPLLEVRAGATEPIAKRLIEAAEAGDALRVLAAGPILIKGQGAPRDILRGLALYRREALKGNTQAMIRLAEALRDQLESRSGYYYWVRRAAELGEVKALSRLGHLHLHGGITEFGETPDGPTARRWLLQAKAQGDRQAMTNLGLIHLDGLLGFKRNEAMGRSYLAEAIKAGSRDAMVVLARDLLRGGAAEQKQARALLERVRDHPDAQLLRASLLREGRAGFAKDLRQARRCLRAAAGQGLVGAQWELGAWLHSEGKSPRDRQEGLGWIRKAALAGYTPARRFFEDWQRRNAPD